MITYNQDKENGAVNGATGTIIAFTKNQVTVQLDSGKVVGVHWQKAKKGVRTISGFPLTATYAVTIAKMLGRTLPSITIVPDLPMPACGYVAISRVPTRRALHWLYKPDTEYFRPHRVQRLTFCES